MQEEVENRTLTLVVSGTKFTGRLMKAAITKYLAHRKEKKLQKQKSRDTPVIPHGKQTVKQLIGQNQGVSNIRIRAFPTSRSPTPPSRSLKRSPGNTALTMR